MSLERTKPDVGGRFCVLVNSTDRGRDIFEIVYRNADAMWRACDWPRFAGFTSAQPSLYGFTSVSAKAPSDWRCELIDQLDSLPAEIEYVLRLEEDCLFLSPVDARRLGEIAETMVRDGLSCVRLVPVSRSVLLRGLEYVRRKLSASHSLRPVAFSEPYYSSLAPAIWKRCYLRDLLGRPGSIWDFEFVVSGERHYAVWGPVFHTDHVVTKGKWCRRAPRVLARQGFKLAGSKREIQPLRSWLRQLRERMSFQLFGYLSLRIRQRLNLMPSVPKDLIRDQFSLAPRKE